MSIPARPKPGDAIICKHLQLRVTASLGPRGEADLYLAEAEGAQLVEIFRLGDQLDLPKLAAELDLLQRLSARHEALLRVRAWELDAEAGRGMVVCERLPGLDLASRVRRDGTLTDVQLKRLLRDLSEALTVLHDNGLLHLDLRPENVLQRGDRFVLADFAAAHAIGRSYSGAPGYRAPEQARAETEFISARTDIYSLGATAWAAATGRVLTTADEVASSHAFYGLPPLHRRAPQLSEALSNTIMETLRFKPARRVSSVAAIQHQLDHPPGLYSVLEGRTQERRPSASVAMTHVNNPLLRHALSTTPALRLVQFERGDRLCSTGESSFHAFMLVQGEVRVEREGVTLTTVDSPGEILGETAALTGTPRTAAMVAASPTVVAAVFNSAELLDFLRGNPEFAIQLVTNLAERLARESRS